MHKWTRRGFIAAGLAAGGVFAVGVGIREGNRAPSLASRMEADGETLINVWVKLTHDNRIIAIVPHSGNGAGGLFFDGADAGRGNGRGLESGIVRASPRA